MQTCNRTLLILNRRSRTVFKIQRQFRDIRLVRVRHKHRPTSHDEPPLHSTRYSNDQRKRKHSSSQEFSLSPDHKYFHTYSDCSSQRRILLVSMVLVAPLIRGNLFLHRVNVLAAALPRGLSAYVAGGGSTHDVLLWKVRLGSVGDSLRIDECCIRMSCVVSALGQAEEELLEFLHRHLLCGHERLRIR